VSIVRSQKSLARVEGRKEEIRRRGRTSNGRESRILPTRDVSFRDEPVQLPLGEESVDEVESTAREI